MFGDGIEGGPTAPDEYWGGAYVDGEEKLLMYSHFNGVYIEDGEVLVLIFYVYKRPLSIAHTFIHIIQALSMVFLGLLNKTRWMEIRTKKSFLLKSFTVRTLGPGYFGILTSRPLHPTSPSMR